MYFLHIHINKNIIMNKPMTCKELAEILMKTPDKPVMIAKANIEGDLIGVCLESYKSYLDEKYIETVTLKDGTEAVVLDDDPWL